MLEKLKSVWRKIVSYDNIGVVVALIVVLIIGAIFTPSMYSLTVIMRLLKTNMLYGIVAVGVMFVLITGGIDLSTGAIMSLACNVVGVLQISDPRGEPIPVFVLILIRRRVLRSSGSCCALPQCHDDKLQAQT